MTDREYTCDNPTALCELIDCQDCMAGADIESLEYDEQF